jgi:hypothetical protein
MRAHIQSRIDSAIRAARAAVSHRAPPTPAIFDYMIPLVRGRSGLLRGACEDAELVVQALLALALHHADWLRPLEAWAPAAGSARVLVASLAAHLLARYPVPRFLDRAWFDGPLGEVMPQHGWYKHAALGGSLRTAGFPARLTRAAAHALRGAPHHYAVSQALRWAQVRGAGGHVDLAAAVATSRLGELRDADFELDVIRFFVDHAVEPDQAVALVALVIDRRGDDAAYSLAGRTATSLSRDAMDVVRPHLLRAVGVTWKHSRFQDFRFVEDRPAGARTWTITELLSSADLIDEARALRHCVATYTPECRRRRSAIWSMRLESAHGSRRVATIEVELCTGVVKQARGRFNRWAAGAELHVLVQWAAAQGLELSRALRR